VGTLRRLRPMHDTGNDDWQGSELSGWTIGRRIAIGPRGEVYEAAGRGDVPVIIRILPRSRSADEAFRVRFITECDAIAAIESQGIARILGRGTERGRLWCAVERLADGTVMDALRRGEPLPPAQVLRLGIGASRGLAAAHLAGLLHRGLQPSDVLVDWAQGRVALAGFALARDVSGWEAVRAVVEQAEIPLCASPELLRGRPLDQRSDLYSLGCILAWALAGRPPFTGSAEELRRQHLEVEPTVSAERGSTGAPALVDIIHRLMAKDPAGRYPNAMALTEDLSALSRGGTTVHLRTAVPAASPVGQEAPAGARAPRPPTRTRAWMAVIAVAGLGVAGGLAATWPTSHPSQTSVAEPAGRPPSPAPVAAPVQETAVAATLSPAPEPAPAYTIRVDPEPSPPSVAARTDPADQARRQRQVADLVAQAGHLGPLADLTARLGTPDMQEDGGKRVWYADHVFVVVDGWVVHGGKVVERTESIP
jgi:hypothetical protein